MARSDHNGCGRTCGLCRPHKKTKHQLSRIQKMRPNQRRKVQGERRWCYGWIR